MNREVSTSRRSESMQANYDMTLQAIATRVFNELRRESKAEVVEGTLHVSMSALLRALEVTCFERDEARDVAAELFAAGLVQLTEEGDDEDEEAWGRIADDDERVCLVLRCGRDDARVTSASGGSSWLVREEVDEEVEALCIGAVDPRLSFNAELLDCVHPKDWEDPMPRHAYNMVVIGGGVAGLVTAAGSAGVGGRVALVEEQMLGGDCLVSGCVPSKALLACAQRVVDVRQAGRFGVRLQGEVGVDFAAIMERMRRLRAKIAPHDSAQRFSDELGIDVFQGRARFTSNRTVEVNGQTIKFRRALIATGGRPFVPDVPGLEGNCVTSETVFNLTELPAQLVVLGGGPIGCELAQAFARFGSQVTLLEHGGGVLQREEAAAREVLAEALARDGVQVLMGAELERVDDGVLSVRLASGQVQQMEADTILVAAGRRPNVRDLGLEEAGVEYDARQGVLVNEFLQTSNPKVYAAGDVATPFQFTHMADAMARIVVRNALFLGRARHTALLVPWCTYTEPAVAHVGKYARELDEEGVEYDEYRRELCDVDRVVLERLHAEDDEDERLQGFVQVLCKKGTDVILGATVVGHEAGDVIATVVVAMQSGTGLGAIAGCIFPYPTVSEALKQCGDAYNRTRLTPLVKKSFQKLLGWRNRFNI